MDTNDIKRLLQKIVPRKASPQAIEYARIVNGVIYATDLDKEIEIDTGLSGLDGFLDVKLFYKSLRLESSMSRLEFDTWPDSIVEPGEFKRIAVCDYPKEDIFNSVKFSKFSPYIEIDKNRPCLNGVFFDAERGGKLVAVDGYTFIAENNPGVVKSFVLPEYTFTIIDRLPEIKEARLYRITSVYNTEKEKWEEKTFEIPDYSNAEEVKYKKIPTYYDFLELRGEGFVFRTRLLNDSIYLDYPKLIPEYSGALRVLSKEQIEIYITALKQIQPFTNEKTRLVMIYKNRIITRQDDLYRRVDLPFTPAPTEYERWVKGEEGYAVQETDEYFLVGFNCDYLIRVLTEALTIPSDTVTINYPQTVRTACVIPNKEKTLLIMPIVAVGEHDFDNQSMECLPLEHPAQVKKATKPKLDRRIEKLCLAMQQEKGVNVVLNILQGVDLI